MKINSIKPTQSLQIIRRPHLTKGQKDLLKVICDKLDNDEKILYADAKEIWINKVCRNVENGIPYYYNYYKERYIDKDGEHQFKGGFEPMPESWIPFRVLSWLTSNIGTLVLKGYLEVIPQINIKQIKQQL